MAFTYDETRDNETLRLLTPAIDAFIAQYQTPLDAESPCPRQTVFFFPGGMASQLTRATTKFVDGAAAPQTFQYDTVWVTLETPVGGARDLKMHRDGTGTFRDKGDRIIIADAALSFGGCTPHDGLIAWCASNNADLFVYPWDWRRRLEETVKFFVARFLPFFRARVQNAGCPDPLARFAVVGHSFGGMIANLILRGNDPIVTTLTHVITVGTPFYGYSGQLHRWFEGEPFLNFFGLFKPDMMETIASLPALYTLHFLDEATFTDTTIQAALAVDDAEFPIPGYPSMDATTATLHADAYNPQTNGGLVRYPTLTGFDRAELDYARLQFRQLAGPMDPNLLQKFYNIRGVRVDTNGGALNNTVGSVTWDWIPTNFDASDASPIVDGAPVPGDDTQPAWSARLATNAARTVTVKAGDLEHAFLLSHESVLTGIQAILCPEGAEVSPSETPQPEPASDDDIVEFLRWLSENRLRLKHIKRFDDPALQRLMPRRFSAKLPGIARRFISDVMKRPGPKGLRGPDGDTGGREPRGPESRPPKAPGRQPAARKPAPQRRQRKSSKKRR